MTKQEKRQKNKETRALLGRFLKGSKLLFALSMFSAALASLADMISPQIIRAAIDNAIGGKEASFPAWVMHVVDALGGFAYLGENLWIMALAVVAVALVKVTSQYVFRVSNTKASETLVKTMRDTAFSHIEHLPFSWHMKNKTGDIIQRCTSDIDTMKSFVSEQLTNVFRILVMLILSLLFMFSMNVPLTLIAFIPMPVIIGYSLHFHTKFRKGFMDCDENEGKLSTIAQENLTGVRVVRAFGRERFEKDKFEAQNAYYTSLWEKLGRIMSRFWSTSDALSGLQILLVVVFGAVFCIRGQMQAGEYVAFISYNAMLMWPIRMLGRMIADMSKAGVSIERIKYIMDSEPEHDPPEALCPEIRGDIVFDHVSFAYENCPPMLQDVSFTMEAGTTLGILGGTGSGKSTMMYLLDKLYPLEEGKGTIYVGGVDIRRIKTDWLRRHIGIVLQEPFLFSRTISENIAIACDGTDMTSIKAAAAAACLDETIESFSKGYDTFVGERGVTLSGGQKQRAAIARTLTGNTPIMIFDDSLSAVDTETDAKIRARMEERFGTASIILISHRITTLAKADKILVVENGRIVEQGTHDELKCAGGIYQSIYEIQSGTVKEAQV